MPNDVKPNAARVAHADLIRFIAAAYRAVGIPEADAAKAAELMAASDIGGADGHGVFRLPQYIRRIKAGGLNVRPEITVIRQARAAAYGKVKVATQQGKTMPEGWMIDRQGQPLTDPSRADDGFLLPIGGYKGAALALMFGLLAGTLNGAANGADVVDFNKDDTTPTNTGQAICVLDIKAFAEPLAFKRQVDTVIRQLHGSALLPSFDRIRLPGEDRHHRIEERRAHGIPIPSELRAALDKLAADLHIPPLFG